MNSATGVSRETPNGAWDRARPMALSIFGSPKISGRPERAFPDRALSGRLRELASGFPAEIRRQDAQRGGRHAIKATRLTDGQRPRGSQLPTDLVGESGHQTVVDITKDERFIAPEGIDVGDLALEVNVVLGIDFEMCRDALINRRKFRPD